MKKMIIGGVVAAGVALGMAAPAQATPDDDAFLQVIAEHGFYDPDGDPLSGYIRLGHQTCDDLASGNTLMEEVRHLQYWTTRLTGSYLSTGDAAYFIGAAHAAYCPWIDIAGTDVA